MTKTRHFDLLTSPLEGTNLIEASARLILEKNLSINEILVVTFTVPATEELKDRIRIKLREAIEAFNGGKIEDSFLIDLVRRHTDPKTALRSLGQALRSFDQAAIFTIHGFCRRILHENAFESGSLFDTELVTDQENLKREIVDDFWRTHFYTASSLFVNYAINNKFNPENLLSLLANRDAQPYLKIIPQVEWPDTSAQERGFRDIFNKTRKAWQSSRGEVEKILMNDEGLNRSKYSKVKISVWIQGMDDLMSTGGNNPILFQNFKKFTSSEINGAVKNDHIPPAHPFFEFCERLREKQGELASIFDQRLMGLKVALFHYMHDELIKRKGEKNIQFFDDLLLKVYRALQEKDGEALARTIGNKFRAALIDEFQDTDPIQYAIFRKIFGTEKSTLFLIGDPKQAIYSFRGADIFAYMDAAGDVESRFTLGENWRSEPDLIAAINTIFTRVDRPFIYEQIPFQSVSPAANKGPESLIIDNKKESPLQLWFLATSKVAEPGKVINKTQARGLISRAVAGEISRLISLGRSNRALLRKTPLREGDIAVLVRTHYEAHTMQKTLSALNIPSVLYTSENLFDSHEALEMERVMAGINQPNNDGLLKAALTTEMMGVKGEELDDLIQDEAGWEEWLVKFRHYHDLWGNHGFIQMFRHLLVQEKILTRLMPLPDGERRNTNLLHLAEVLHQTSIESKLAMAGLLKWLSEQRDQSTPRLDEYQLRLESDENAVKLVTIHKSKGLEYPVVFCPFVWTGSKIKKNNHPFTFHDSLNHMRLTLDLGSPAMDENRVFAEKEELAENLRLLYVALTRARNRCYLVWGRFRDAETSAPAYLFHQQGSWKGDNVVNSIEERLKTLSDEDMRAELKILVDNPDGIIRLSEMPTETGEKYSPLPEKEVVLSSRTFSGNIDRQWHISSFSSLISGQQYGAELADHDAINLASESVAGRPHTYSQKAFKEPVIEEPSDIFSFPRGTKAGTCLHDIFEHLDFVQKDTSVIKELIANKLIEYGFELIWQETLYDMIRNVLSVPLEPERSDFTLSHIRSQDRINELGFYFPLKSISTKKLNNIFAEYAGPELSKDFPERIERLDFTPVRGFMRGFMDMVFQFQGQFYLVDWKSNLLGSGLEYYDQKGLAKAMKDEFYSIQCHIYIVALNQYLQLRLPGYTYETHFGGAYYIFLRGVDPNEGTEFGIYRERPSGKFINKLGTNLIDETGTVKP
ncbi:MAG: exodeoxyribonuclease V subunit beta [Deltaproteobacteria bacterium]|nr:exodeoxyribonuclease V subunit beta [Deltaproteobacteria bacterium]